MPRLDAGVDGGVEGGPKAPSEVSRVNHLQPPPGRGGGALSDTPHSMIRTAGSSARSRRSTKLPARVNSTRTAARYTWTRIVL